MQMGKIYIGDVCKEYKGQFIDLFIARFPRFFSSVSIHHVSTGRGLLYSKLDFNSH